MDEKNRNNRPMSDKNPKRKQTIILLLVAAVVTILGTTFMSMIMQNATTKEITYDEFLKMIDDDEIESVEFDSSGKIVISPKGNEKSYIKFTYWTTQLNDPDIIAKLEKSDNIKFKGKMDDSSSGMLLIILEYVVPFVLIYVFFMFIMRRMSKGGGGIMVVVKSNAKVYVEK